MGFQLIIDTVYVLLAVTFWNLVSLVKFIIPARFLPKKDIRGKVVLVTGSGSGLGRILALKLGKLGGRIILWDVNDQGNAETLELLKKQNVEAKEYHVNLSDYNDINKVANQVKQDYEKVDILVNNAGIANGRMLLDCPDELISRAFNVNVLAHHYTVKNFLQRMLDDDDGHIVTIASMAGKMVSAGLIDYTSTKFAAVGFNDALTAEIGELKKYGVKTTLVCPYYINTPMFNGDGAITRFPSLFPILEPEYVTDKIVEGIQLNTQMIIMPRMFYLVAATVSLMPFKVQEIVGEYLNLPQDIARFHHNKKQ